MACSFYDKENNKCLSGFPVTTGCFATAGSVLEKNMIKHVFCVNEEFPIEFIQPAIKKEREN